MRVLVAMSGGVDSSVAALQMVAAGHDVTGVFMRLWDPEAGRASRCCSLEDLEDARRVASHLGIALHEECLSQRFYEEIFLSALSQYARGLTPNPCVTCNERIKFHLLSGLLGALEADLMVTGHYARCSSGGEGQTRLLRALDHSKDQSYFLHRLSQENLGLIRFPLGGQKKGEVRRQAAAAGLPVASKAESQDICFVPDGTTYADLFERFLPDAVRPGAIRDSSGRRIGSHQGVHRFTVGQRRGLGVSARGPIYVIGIDAETATVVAGPEDELLVSEFEVEDLRWVAGQPPAERFRSDVRVRSRHRGVEADVAVGEGSVRVEPSTPLRAPSPGQAAVFYCGDEVLGGGWIRRPGAV